MPRDNPVQFQAKCIDGPFEGELWVLRLRDPIMWLGPNLDQPYRAVQEEGTEIWYYVYADSIDDDPPIALSKARKR